MLKIIPGLLQDETLQAVSGSVASADFQDGKLSAGSIAKRVKNNQEASIERDRLIALNRIVVGAYLRNEQFRQLALPYRMAEPYYALYQTGMYYGDHVDDPVMGPELQRYRSDLSTTLFLNSPDDYEGGELSLETPFGRQQVKLNAGDAVIYPSNFLHRVEEVTAGKRLVAVSWIQSLVRSSEQRQILAEMAQTRDSLQMDTSTEKAAASINNCYANLLRMWSDV